MFDDAFTAIARDGAAAVEVTGRLQKGLASLATFDDVAMRDPARAPFADGAGRAESVLRLSEDLQTVRSFASFANER